jgi:hypothetical protein
MGSIDEHSHRKRAGSDHHRYRGKFVYGRNKVKAIQHEILDDPVDPKRPVASYIITQDDHTHKQNNHPLTLAIANMRWWRRLDRKASHPKKSYLRRSIRCDIRSNLAHGCYIHIHSFSLPELLHHVIIALPNTIGSIFGGECIPSITRRPHHGRYHWFHDDDDIYPIVSKGIGCGSMMMAYSSLDLSY